MWSFPDRGSWATHNGGYRGNWSPYIPRNIITRYSLEQDWVLDQFVGGGTTLVEAKLLNRNAIGVDVNIDALHTTNKNLQFEMNGINPRIVCKNASACDLSFIKDNSVDLICTHPPYADIIKYSDGINEDVSRLSLEKFMEKMNLVAKESYRVLKGGKICAFMMGDIRKNGRVIPLGFEVMNAFKNVGFNNKEIIIKEQYNCRSSSYWMNKKRSFLMLAHEYIFVMEK